MDRYVTLCEPDSRQIQIWFRAVSHSAEPDSPLWGPWQGFSSPGAKVHCAETRSSAVAPSTEPNPVLCLIAWKQMSSYVWPVSPELMGFLCKVLPHFEVELLTYCGIGPWAVAMGGSDLPSQTAQGFEAIFKTAFGYVQLT
jgi:hypothetical protein